MSTIDLHIHSIESEDGDKTPAEIVSLCEAAGVTLAAVANHNNTHAVGKFLDAARGTGVRALPAIELDCEYGNTVLHVAGYGIDYTDPVYEEIWQTYLARERQAGRERAAKTRALGIDFSDEDAMSFCRWGMITGEAIFEAALLRDPERKSPLLQPYYPGGERAGNSFVNFYWDFCGPGSPAYVKIRFISLAEAISTIRRTGGVPVMTHPGQNIHEDLDALGEIIAAGVAGLEVYSSYHSPAQVAFYKHYAQKNGLLVTCGSDYHGKLKPNIEVGSVDCEGREAEISAALLEAIG